MARSLIGGGWAAAIKAGAAAAAAASRPAMRCPAMRCPPAAAAAAVVSHAEGAPAAQEHDRHAAATNKVSEQAKQAPPRARVSQRA